MKQKVITVKVDTIQDDNIKKALEGFPDTAALTAKLVLLDDKDQSLTHTQRTMMSSKR